MKVLVFAVSLFLSVVVLGVPNDPPFPFPSSYTRFVPCNGCESTGMWGYRATQEFGSREGGVVYLVDYEYKQYRKVYVYVVSVATGEPHNPYIYRKKSKQISNLNSTEIEAFNAMLGGFDKYSQVIGNLQDLYGPRSVKDFDIGEIYINQDPNGENVYDFLETSKMRNDMFDFHWKSHTFTFHALFNQVVSTIGLGFIGLESFGVNYTLIFPDGTNVKVFPSLTLDTLSISKGTAFDADNNTIPHKLNDAAGVYNFTTNKSALSMIDHFEGYLGIEVNFEFGCQIHTMACTWSGPVMNCFASCP